MLFIPILLIMMVIPTQSFCLSISGNSQLLWFSTIQSLKTTTIVYRYRCSSKAEIQHQFGNYSCLESIFLGRHFLGKLHGPHLIQTASRVEQKKEQDLWQKCSCQLEGFPALHLKMHHLLCWCIPPYLSVWRLESVAF